MSTQKHSPSSIFHPWLAFPSSPVLASQVWDSSSSSVPKNPGVYWFLSDVKKVMYVGKAKNLKNRLSSYKFAAKLDKKTSSLIKQVRYINFFITQTPIDAELLEAQLIHAHKPPYNIQLKDDKSRIYVIVTDEKFPKVLIRRKTQLNNIPKSNIFGPFSSSSSTKELVRKIRSIYPFCTSHKMDRACMYYHLKLCPGPCISAISQKDYQKNIDAIKKLLSGNVSIKKIVKIEIEKCIETKDFERAQKLKAMYQQYSAKNSIYNPLKDGLLPSLSPHISSAQVELERLLKEKKVISKTVKLHRIEAYDVSNIMGKNAAVSMVVAINGKIDTSEYRLFNIKTLHTPNDVGMLKEALSRRVNHPEWGLPQLIILDGGRGQVNQVKKVFPWTIPVIGIAKRPDRLIFKVDGTFHQHKLIPKYPYTKLITTLRNESHRFAKKQFSKRYAKKIVSNHL